VKPVGEPDAGDGMGNGALPHGPSDRAHPRLYLLGPRETSELNPQSEPKADIDQVASPIVIL
jgi:hypothetical protein